ncbi:hypothetical protein BH10BAC5_BH10BAC5_02790 [soil metagenome]
MSLFIVKKQISIKAHPEQVWQALTDPQKTKEYFFNCEVHSDWKPGSPITFKGKLLLVKPIEMHGTITKIEPGKLLQYTLQNKSEDEKPATTSKVTDELTSHNGETILSITDDVGQEEGAEERYEKSQKGWDKILEGLKEYLEKEKND